MFKAKTMVKKVIIYMYFYITWSSLLILVSGWNVSVLREPCSEEHLLPASPSEREIAVPVSASPGPLLSHPLTLSKVWPLWLPPPQQEVNCTLFLLAGYVKYGRPYAWIRSNHERLVNIGGTDSMVKDTPMKLKSISDWQTRGMETMWGIQTRKRAIV